MLSLERGLISHDVSLQVTLHEPSGIVLIKGYQRGGRACSLLCRQPVSTDKPDASFDKLDGFEVREDQLLPYASIGASED